MRKIKVLYGLRMSIAMFGTVLASVAILASYSIDISLILINGISAMLNFVALAFLLFLITYLARSYYMTHEYEVARTFAVSTFLFLHFLASGIFDYLIHSDEDIVSPQTESIAAIITLAIAMVSVLIYGIYFDILRYCVTKSSNTEDRI